MRKPNCPVFDLSKHCSKFSPCRKLWLTKTKALLRSEIFFLNIDKITTQILALCFSYSSVTPWHNRHKLSQPTPSETLDTTNLYFLGSFANDQYVFVMIDQRRKYPVVELTRSASAKNAVFTIKPFFTSYGIPNKIIQDNDPPFTSFKPQE